MYRNQDDEMPFEYAANRLLKFNRVQKPSFGAVSQPWIRRRNKLFLASSLVLGAVGVAGPQPASAAPCVDTDGDGWGWDGTDTCTDVTDLEPQNAAGLCVDPDGDGWGWDGTATCTDLPAAKVVAESGPGAMKHTKQVTSDPSVDDTINPATDRGRHSDSDGFDRQSQPQTSQLGFSFFPSGGSAGGSADSWEPDQTTSAPVISVYENQVEQVTAPPDISVWTSDGSKISPPTETVEFQWPAGAILTGRSNLRTDGNDVVITDEPISENDPRYSEAWRPVDQWGNEVEQQLQETRVSYENGERVETVRDRFFTPDRNDIFSGPPIPQDITDESSHSGSVESLADDVIQATNGVTASVPLSSLDLDGVVARTVVGLSQDRLASKTTNHTVMNGKEDAIELTDVSVTTNTGIVTKVTIDGQSAPQSVVDSVQRGIGRSLPSPDLGGGNSLTDHDESGVSAPSSSDAGYSGSYAEVGNLGLSGAAG